MYVVITFRLKFHIKEVMHHAYIFLQRLDLVNLKSFKMFFFMSVTYKIHQLVIRSLKVYQLHK